MSPDDAGRLSVRRRARPVVTRSAPLPPLAPGAVLARLAARRTQDQGQWLQPDTRWQGGSQGIGGPALWGQVAKYRRFE